MTDLELEISPKTEQKAYQPVKANTLRYYIHDSTSEFRFQLIGQLNEPHVRELNCCWTTAKSSVAAKSLIFDLRELSALDDAGRQWLLLMAGDGARFTMGGEASSRLPATLNADGEGKSPERNSCRIRRAINAVFRGRQQGHCW